MNVVKTLWPSEDFLRSILLHIMKGVEKGVYHPPMTELWDFLDLHKNETVLCQVDLDKLQMITEELDTQVCMENTMASWTYAAWSYRLRMHDPNLEGPELD